jgi:hypothetical protein
MRMKHLIERCERQNRGSISEIADLAGPLFMAGMAGAALLPMAGIVGGDIGKGRMMANKEAEACHQRSRGGKGCPSCAKGYHMNDKTGKCEPAKGIGNKMRRAFDYDDDED